jgi:molybdopterin-guanine dinucleotide biosynthesis protein A
MGFDKALLEVEGQANAARLAAALSQALGGPLVEVGPGLSGLASVQESPPGRGPLAALVAGSGALARAGWEGPVLAVACDLPLLSAAALAQLAGWPGPASLVPVWRGEHQPLCARWSAADLELARRLVSEGARSMRALLEAASFEELGPGQWAPGAGAEQLADVDTPEDLGRLGLAPGAGPAS